MPSLATTRPDFLIVGGGVIGLSLAYELAGKGHQVLLVEKGPLGREASWAGAGLLPPANEKEAWDPQEQLRGLSHRLFPEWSARLKAETQIDNQFEITGGLYLARDPGEAASLRMACVHYEEEGVEVQRLDPQQLAEHFPHLQTSQSIRDAVFLPGEAVVRNPRHLQALVQGCRNRGVQFLENTEVARWRFQDTQLTAVEIDGQEISPGACCLATGAWSQLLTDQVLDRGNFSGRIQRPEIEPIRGQLVLLDAGGRFFTSPINEGVRYIVPRRDGLVLVGATVEEVGFDKSNTPEAIEDLTQFARQWVPKLAEAKQVKAWSGLRPASVDRIPYLGQLPGMANIYLAAGHYRSGLHLSPATATVMSQLMCGETPQIDLHPFRVNRA
ncbi:glycine oxidase ThiO [Blastopirellula marina]|uniref:Glycine oxidase ThiO n=1 Tax=Blastopirellula marina TaxID=124 RepID=A0A2S8G3T7_9BACT|nr:MULTISPECIES: glycine oxidase ThiO [Pirellulaceae]PQO39119.1 glycine oxidase ThiO [Blastopirellula marina]RCS55427.1 glycine oxidase ThiO [Bremerella cremea]